MPYCPNCGAECEFDDRFCTQCGTWLPDSGITDSASVGERDRESQGDDLRAGGRDPRSDDVDRAREGVTSRRGDGLDFAFSYPVADGYAEVLKGGVLVIVSFLIVPLIVLSGYGIALGKSAARGETVPPALEGWGDMLVDGLKLIVALLITGAAVVGVVLGASAGIGAINDAIAAAAVFAGYVLGGYVQTAVLTVFVGTGSLRTALTTRRALDLALSSFYLKAALKHLALVVILWIMLWLSVLTLVGWLFVLAYATMAIGAFWGYTYHEAAREGIVPRLTSAEDRTNERRSVADQAYW